ncbi:MAG: hypothetical protein IT537_11630 [Hyphomicrobiales bacterium]|nr:hypothetical protein [Hyphomicrobiales bacterium]
MAGSDAGMSYTIEVAAPFTRRVSRLGAVPPLGFRTTRELLANAGQINKLS